MVFLVIHSCYSHHIIVSLFGNSWCSHHSCLVNGPSCTPVSQPTFWSCPHLSSMNHLICPGWSIHFLLCSCPSTLDNHTTSLCPCLSGLDVLTTFLWPLITSVVVECLQGFNTLLEQFVMLLSILVRLVTLTISGVILYHCQHLQGGDQLYHQSLPEVVLYHCCELFQVQLIFVCMYLCSLSWVPSNLLVPLLLSPNVLVTSSLVHSKDNILIFSQTHSDSFSTWCDFKIKTTWPLRFSLLPNVTKSYPDRLMCGLLVFRV